LIAWGETEGDVEAACAALNTVAAGLVEARADAGVAPPAVLGRSRERERLLLALRSHASRSRPSVLSIDGSLASIANRPDVADLARLTASQADAALPFDPAAGIVRGIPAQGSALPEEMTLLVEGVGLVTAGSTKAAADARGVVGAHAYRVISAIADSSRSDQDGSHRGPGAGSPAYHVPDPTRSIMTGRVYIVTGAASGIGRDIARHLARLGAELAIADMNGVALQQTAAELEAIGARPVAVSGDLTLEAVVDSLVSSTVETFGGIDGAVLNAGVALPGEIRSLSAADWQRSLDVNATSHFLLARRLLPVLEAQGLGGSLVFIGSKNMFSPGAGFGAYSASKAALAQLARVIAIEAGPFGVRSNIVNPDNVFEGSALWSPELRAQRAAVYGIEEQRLEEYYTQRNLMKVPISGTDVARAVAFLLSEESRRTTACVVTVDGGVPGVFPR
jgi:NAD(P)-dependent dehydrogenase (short-subunit alcohol dehydrogenase family)